jgi:enoyl-CoA hydratase/carnithine racemase
VFGLDETAAPTVEGLREHLNEPPYQDGVRDTGGKVTLAIHACDKPVIAAINGAAVGIGATMTLGMDIRLAATTARIGFVFGRLGIVPEAASSFFLPRLVGLQTALEWVYAADLIPADEANRKGLLRSVHEPEELLPAARGLALSFVRDRSPAAIAMARRLLYAGAGASHPLQAHQRESLAMWHASVGDGKEGVAAFLAKRAPVFTHRASDIPELG